MAGARIVSGLVALTAAVGLAGVAAPAEAARKSGVSSKVCAQGEWRQWLTHDGQSFTTQGSCARYVSRGGTLRTNPYPQGKQTCDLLPHGTFAVTDARFYTAWTCEWRAAGIGAAEHDRLWLACRAEGGDWGGEVPADVAGRVAFQCFDSPETPAG